MYSCVFSTQFLKFKNNKVYLLNEYDLAISNYDEENYFIDFNEIDKNKIFKINNINVEYNILLNENDENLLIRINISENLEDVELNNLLHCIEKYISGYKDFDVISENNDFLKNYTKKIIKI
jgi:hypothetical protein